MAVNAGERLADFFFDRGGSGDVALANAEDQATARSLIGPSFPLRMAGE